MTNEEVKERIEELAKDFEVDESIDINPCIARRLIKENELIVS